MQPIIEILSGPGVDSCHRLWHPTTHEVRRVPDKVMALAGGDPVVAWVLSDTSYRDLAPERLHPAVTAEPIDG